MVTSEEGIRTVYPFCIPVVPLTFAAERSADKPQLIEREGDEFFDIILTLSYCFSSKLYVFEIPREEVK